MESISSNDGVDATASGINANQMNNTTNTPIYDEVATVSSDSNHCYYCRTLRW